MLSPLIMLSACCKCIILPGRAPCISFLQSIQYTHTHIQFITLGGPNPKGQLCTSTNTVLKMDPGHPKPVRPPFLAFILTSSTFLEWRRYCSSIVVHLMSIWMPVSNGLFPNIKIKLDLYCPGRDVRMRPLAAVHEVSIPPTTKNTRGSGLGERTRSTEDPEPGYQCGAMYPAARSPPPAELYSTV